MSCITSVDVQKLYRLKVRRSVCLQPLIDIGWIQRMFVLKPKPNKMLVAVISFHFLGSLAVVWEVAVVNLIPVLSLISSYFNCRPVI